MNALDRMLTALSRKGIPDRVPIFVEGMMNQFRSQSDLQYGDEIDEEMVLLSGGDWTWAKFYRFDSIWLHSSPVKMKPLKNIDLDAIHLEDPKAQVSRFGGVGLRGIYQTGYLNTKELWQEWIDAGYFDYEVDNEWIRFWEKNYPQVLDRDLVLVPVDVIFEKVREAFSFGRFSYFLRKERPFLEMLTKKIFDVMLDFVKGVCDAGFHIITLADDSAYKGRVMFSPQIFEELVVPHYRRLNDYAHKRGLLSFFHSDGFTEPFFPGLIQAGFNGIQSLEPAAGMNLKHLKDTFGSQVTLIGNMDVSILLPFGTQQDVENATRQCLSDAMTNGGYIFGPCTDIIDSCRPENIKTMVDTIYKFGNYSK
jgi:hypothetical protein